MSYTLHFYNKKTQAPSVSQVAAFWKKKGAAIKLKKGNLSVDWKHKLILNYSEGIPDDLDWDEKIPEGYEYCDMEVSIHVGDQQNDSELLKVEKVLREMAHNVSLLIYDPQLGEIWKIESEHFLKNIINIIKIVVCVLAVLFVSYRVLYALNNAMSSQRNNISKEMRGSSPLQENTSFKNSLPRTPK